MRTLVKVSPRLMKIEERNDIKQGPIGKICRIVKLSNLNLNFHGKMLESSKSIFEFQAQFH